MNNFNLKKPPVNPARLGKACNQALQALLHKGLNIESDENQKRYVELALLFLRLDDEIERRSME